MKEPMLCDKAQHKFVRAKIDSTTTHTDFLPTISDRRRQSGWNLVFVIMKAVVSQDASFEALE